MTDTAIVTVDIQRDFLRPAGRGIGSWQKAFCVSGAARLVSFGRARGWRVCHVATEHTGTDSLPAHQRRREVEPYCVSGTAGAELVLPRESDDIVVVKQWYSAFDGALDPVLAGIETIVWAGVATDCCVQQSAFDADRRGLRSVIPIQAVSASTRAAFVASLTALAKSAAEIVDLDTFLDDGGGSRPLPLDEVSRVAGEWFDDRERSLPASDDADLVTVLRALD